MMDQENLSMPHARARFRRLLVARAVWICGCAIVPRQDELKRKLA